MVSSKADTESNDPEWENQIQQMLDAEENQINWSEKIWNS